MSSSHLKKETIPLPKKWQRHLGLVVVLFGFVGALGCIWNLLDPPPQGTFNFRPRYFWYYETVSLTMFVFLSAIGVGFRRKRAWVNSAFGVFVLMTMTSIGFRFYLG